MESITVNCSTCGKDYRVYEGEQNECPHCNKDSEGSLWPGRRPALIWAVLKSLFNLLERKHV
jgi:endogenous inhibitor of DNA gyrase (YacG/DUF329 family)